MHRVKQIADKYHGRIEVMNRIAGDQEGGVYFKFCYRTIKSSLETLKTTFHYISSELFREDC